MCTELAGTILDGQKSMENPRFAILMIFGEVFPHIRGSFSSHKGSFSSHSTRFRSMLAGETHRASLGCYGKFYITSSPKTLMEQPTGSPKPHSDLFHHTRGSFLSHKRSFSSHKEVFHHITPDFGREKRTGL